MSMGYDAAFAEVITKEAVKKAVGEKLYSRFAGCLHEFEGDEDYTSNEGEFDVRQCNVDPDSKVFKETRKAYNAVRKQFAKETGIRIFLAYHNSDECGDGYDEVNGWYWSAYLCDLYKPTDALKAFHKKYKKAHNRKFFVIYG